MNFKVLAAIALTLIVCIPVAAGYALATEEKTEQAWETTATYNISDMLINNDSPYYSEYSGTANNSYYFLNYGTTASPKFVPTCVDYVSESSKYSSYPNFEVHANRTVTISSTYTNVQDLGITESIYCFENIPALCVILYNGSDVITSYVSAYNSHLYFYFNNGAVYLFSSDDNYHASFTGVTQVSLACNNYYSSYVVPLFVPSVTGSYGEVAYGWHIPYSPTFSYNGFWYNLHHNDAVCFTVDLSNGNGIVAAIGNISIVRLDGITEVAGYDSFDYTTIGNYEYVYVLFTAHKITVSGIASIPAVGVTPALYNSVSIDQDTDLDLIPMQYTAEPVIRCEYALVQSGTFPDTLDYLLNVGEILPGNSYMVQLNSIGIFGDSLALGADSYTVTDGKITIDGKQINLKGAQIRSVANSDTGLYDNYIDNKQLASTAAPITVYFGGEWSLTATAYLVEETTHAVTSWAPGQFGFDKSTVCACGLIVCGAVLVGLGMYGQRSTAKIGLLLLVCGAAGACYFTLI